MAVIVGTSSFDHLVGTVFADTITGLEGDDILDGAWGDDTFLIEGSNFGRDLFFGGGGNDIIRLSGNVQVSSLMWRSGEISDIDALDFDLYYITGTSGNDIFDISGLPLLINTRYMMMLEGDDIFYGHVGPDLIDGGIGADRLFAGDGNDSMFGNLGDDLMYGGNGDDVFLVYGDYDQIGNDTYDGGQGDDVIRLHEDIYSSRFLMPAANLVEIERLDLLHYLLHGTEGADLIDISGLAIIDNYKAIYLHDGADSFTGFQGSDSVNGGTGNDTLTGGAGNDDLVGGVGNDSLDGGDGDDIFGIHGSDGLESGDIYSGGNGTDAIVLQSDVTASLFTLTRANTIDVEELRFATHHVGGTSGGDVFDLTGVISAVGYQRFNLMDGADSFIGHRGADDADGGVGSDTLVGWSGNDTLLGNDGNDVLNGGLDDDYVAGGAGDDLMTGGTGNDTLLAGVGTDTVIYMVATSGVTVDLGRGGVQVVGGGMGSDVLAGFENIIGSAHADQLIGNSGANAMNGAAGNDLIFGWTGNDTLYGWTGDDTLSGGDGDDMIWGHDGNDMLYGGAGADHFAFQTGGGRDVICDWQDGTDRLLIRAGTAYDTFSELTIRDAGGNAVIVIGDATIALVGVAVSQIDASDFQFV